MATEIVRYRRVSVTREDGQPVKYDARVDIEADAATGAVVYRVYSQVLDGKSVVLRTTGNAAEDTIQLERVCQRMYEFDNSYRVRAVPKPPKSNSAPVVERCNTCGGYGWVEDETGYPVVCGCRA